MAIEHTPPVSSTESTSPGKVLRDQLEQLVPGIFRDGVLDAVRLGELLDSPVAGLKDGKESFGLMWAGRKAAAEALHTPSFASLAPVNADSVGWDTAENVFVIGDNLEVLKLMQTAYNDQVKLVYIDPPYNTGNDFVYNDDFSDPVKHYLEVTGQVDAEGNRLVANTELTGRKHSNWLTMMYPRLVMARNMLTEDGLLAVSIDHNELVNLTQLLDQIFGEENRVGIISVVNNLKGRSDASVIATAHEYLVLYSRGRFVGHGLPLSDEILETYKLVEEPAGRRYRYLPLRKSGHNSLKSDSPSMFYPLFVDPETCEVSIEEFDGSVEVLPLFPDGREGCWRWGKETAGLRSAELAGRQINSRWDVHAKDFLDSADGGARRGKPKSVWLDPKFTSDRGTQQIKEILGDNLFDHPKPLGLILELLTIATSGNDLVVDFFGGSGTTAEAVHRINAEDGGNRRFVLVQIQEPCPEDSLAKTQGYQFVSEITMKRIEASRERFAPNTPEARVYELSASNFRRKEIEDPDALFSSGAETMVENWKPEKVFAEIALNLGIRLDERWERISLENGSAIKAGGALVVTSVPVTDEIIEELADSEANVVVFLEDGFADADSVKANAFSKLKNAKKTVRTY